MQRCSSRAPVAPFEDPHATRETIERSEINTNESLLQDTRLARRPGARKHPRILWRPDPRGPRGAAPGSAPPLAPSLREVQPYSVAGTSQFAPFAQTAKRVGVTPKRLAFPSMSAE